ncbi:Uncharacterised protein [uncultured archaeon]|nr:Uncharacterised protein [uncultured archaeon]
MDIMKKVGWFLGISGLIMFLFGLWLLISPVTTIESIVLIMGIVLFIGGAFSLVEALFASKGADASAGLAAGGVISLLLGLLLLASPSTVALGVVLAFSLLAFLLALMALVAGVAHIVYGLKAKKGRTMQLAVGAVLVLLALFMLFNPFAAGIGLVMAVGIYFLVSGVLLAVLAFSLKGLVGTD